MNLTQRIACTNVLLSPTLGRPAQREVPLAWINNYKLTENHTLIYCNLIIIIFRAVTLYWRFFYNATVLRERKKNKNIHSLRQTAQIIKKIEQWFHEKFTKKTNKLSFRALLKKIINLFSLFMIENSVKNNFAKINARFACIKINLNKNFVGAIWLVPICIYSTPQL